MIPVCSHDELDMLCKITGGYKRQKESSPRIKFTVEYPTCAINDPETSGPSIMPSVNAVSAKAKTREPAPLGPNTFGFVDSHFCTAAINASQQIV